MVLLFCRSHRRQRYLSFLTREKQRGLFLPEGLPQAKITKGSARAHRDLKHWVQQFAATTSAACSGRSQGFAKRFGSPPAAVPDPGKTASGLLHPAKHGTRLDLSGHPPIPHPGPQLPVPAQAQSRHTHYYFYIVDEVAGPMVLRVGSVLPFQVTAYLNGHHFIDGIAPAKDPLHQGRQSFCFRRGGLAESRRPTRWENHAGPIDYWALILGPKFSPRNGPPAPACTASMQHAN